MTAAPAGAFNAPGAGSKHDVLQYVRREQGNHDPCTCECLKLALFPHIGYCFRDCMCVPPRSSTHQITYMPKHTCSTPKKPPLTRVMVPLKAEISDLRGNSNEISENCSRKKKEAHDCRATDI